MRLAVHGDNRLGVVVGDELVDVTHALPWPHDPDPLTAGWWRRLCQDLRQARDALQAAADTGQRRPLDQVRLRAPALNPSKIVACASNYSDHVMGYTIGLDITERGAADRSRRKSYDTFSPIGPWVTTADELGDPSDLDIHLQANGERRQHVHTSTMLTRFRRSSPTRHA